jgi:hypothetical protein
MHKNKIDQKKENENIESLKKVMNIMHSNIMSYQENMINLETIRNQKNYDDIKKHAKQNDEYIRYLYDVSYRLYYKNILGKTDTIVTTFKFTKDKASCIYGFAYSNPTTLNITHITLGPSYLSQDGEYRSGFIQYKKIDMIKKQYPKIWELVENMVIDKINSKKWILDVLFYYPSSIAVNEKKHANIINESRLATDLLICVWLYYFDLIHYGTIYNHTNPAFIYILYEENDVDVYNKSIDLAGGIVEYNNYVAIINAEYMDYHFGQKILSVSSRELSAAASLDIKYPSWREIYISKKCANLKLNYISPSFPVFGDWYLIQNTNASIFDNPSQYVKYENSKIAENIKTNLKSTNNKCYVQNKPINKKFYDLSQHIQKSIKNTNKSLILSDTCVMYTIEHVGRTLKDMTTLANNEHYSVWQMRMALEDYDKFMKYIFEYLYGILAINVKYDLIHGDLHLNNCTVHTYYTLVTKELDRPPVYVIKNPKVLYIIDEDYQYLFEHVGLYSCIIDFSRSVFGPNSPIASDYSDTYSEAFFNAQKDRMMNILFHHFPSFASTSTQSLEELLNNNPEVFFKILSGVDTFSLCKNLELLMILEYPEHKKIKLDKQIIRELGRMKVAAEKYVIDLFQTSFGNNTITASQIKWPSLHIMHEFFQQWKITEKTNFDEYHIADIFNITNPINYDFYDVNQNVPWTDKEFFEKAMHGQNTDIIKKEKAELYKDLENRHILLDDKLVENYIKNIIDKDDIKLDISSSWMIE